MTCSAPPVCTSPQLAKRSSGHRACRSRASTPGRRARCPTCGPRSTNSPTATAASRSWCWSMRRNVRRSVAWARSVGGQDGAEGPLVLEGDLDGWRLRLGNPQLGLLRSPRVEEGQGQAPQEEVLRLEGQVPPLPAAGAQARAPCPTGYTVKKRKLVKVAVPRSCRRRPDPTDPRGSRHGGSAVHRPAQRAARQRVRRPLAVHRHRVVLRRADDAPAGRLLLPPGAPKSATTP